ncbi:hypothetical protein BLS_003102 [Venturia inaequalis]|uniref:Uncharacterized protein n=1 Tax=Venturia inaequalis TaxID=5025 RepID=A0A8H3U4W0_VENIN|nr:hypothetical protein EG328_010902 [Venturia inaequalis]KAE9964013.1 hypothetical protein EG327_001144 [Venturia inaequalis]KAE9974495.1 hypothetical protein BLS_003102 [Venturia inaequalis]RDI87612.1 hypothetical protein Vi05172_g2333 [Venturia inaequalis]
MAEPALDRSVYEELDQYPWDEDTEFQGGLTAILGNDPPPEQASELTLRARCFYYQRKFNKTVDFDAYKSHLRAQQQSQVASAPASDLTPSRPAATASRSNPFPEPTSLPAWTALAATDPPPVTASQVPEGPKLNYQEIVDLIQSGKPIPGIKDIPDTVLAGQGTSATQSRRAKPWEKEGPADGNLGLVAGAIKAGKFMNA